MARMIEIIQNVKHEHDISHLECIAEGGIARILEFVYDQKEDDFFFSKEFSLDKVGMLALAKWLLASAGEHKLAGKVKVSAVETNEGTEQGSERGAQEDEREAKEEC